MPRKTVQQADPAATPEQRPEGRAVIPAPDSGLVLPDGFRVLHTQYDHYTEVHELIVAGPGLPPWHRGEQPARFSSYRTMGDYLHGDRSEVGAEPA